MTRESRKGAGADSSITVRRARPDDAPTMIEITRGVWGGHDYVPTVWETWLRDRTGVLLVAEAGGVPMGLQHVAVQPDNAAWLEGIRVREDVRGMGIGTALLNAGIDWARFNGLVAARLSTSTDNPASNRMAERVDFGEVARFAPVKLAAANGPANTRARVARPDERDAVYRTLLQLTASDFYTEGWTAYRLTPERLEVLLATSAVLVCGGGQPDAIAIATATPERRDPRLGLLAGTPEGTMHILQYLQGTARSLGLDTLRGQLNSRALASERMERWGLTRSWEHDMVLWQLSFG